MDHAARNRFAHDQVVFYAISGLACSPFPQNVEVSVCLNPSPSKDPLHGVTLERLLNELVDEFGWEELGRRIDIRCFRFDPSIKSSLVFLRKNPWARTKVEELYVRWKRQN